MWAMTMRDGSTPALVSASSASRPVLAAAFVWTMTGAPVSTAAAATAARMRGMSPMMPCCLDRAFQEPGPHAGVVDSLAQLAHEQLGDRVGASVAEEVR